MNINGTPHTSIWYDKDQNKIFYIDQTLLPWELKIRELASLDDAVRAINDMEVRGAPLIGVTAAFGYYLGIRDAYRDANVTQVVRQAIAERLLATRPTAINLKWAIGRMQNGECRLENEECRMENEDISIKDSAFCILQSAIKIREEEISRSLSIGQHGLNLIKQAYSRTGKPVNILTHCNAGWLACVEYGTATAPIYLAHEEGIPVHVWVDETRPRNQGAKLTAYELSQHGVPCTLIPDNTGGHLMQNGMVDMVIVGTDRVAANGDVANKIGTYLKALAAADNDVPFYVAMPKSSFDGGTATGMEIPIEQRDSSEVLKIQGFGTRDSGLTEIFIAPDGVQAVNYGFDITPARFVTGFITEDGVVAPSELH